MWGGGRGPDLRGTAPSTPIPSARGPSPPRGGEAVTHIPSSSRSSLPSPLTDVRTAGGRGRDQSHSGLPGELLVPLEREGHSLAPLGSFLLPVCGCGFLAPPSTSSPCHQQSPGDLDTAPKCPLGALNRRLPACNSVPSAVKWG